jgi:hypothetical protein
MSGDGERYWRELWSQSNVPARTGTISADQAPEAPFLLSDYGFPQKLRQLRDIRRDPPCFVAMSALAPKADIG